MLLVLAQFLPDSSYCRSSIHSVDTEGNCSSWWTISAEMSSSWISNRWDSLGEKYSEFFPFINRFFSRFTMNLNAFSLCNYNQRIASFPMTFDKKCNQTAHWWFRQCRKAPTPVSTLAGLATSKDTVHDAAAKSQSSVGKSPATSSFNMLPLFKFELNQLSRWLRVGGGVCQENWSNNTLQTFQKNTKKLGTGNSRTTEILYKLKNNLQ